MSSSVSEGSLVGEGKLLVHIAENGRSFGLDCDETTPVESVQRYIESDSGININDQLLLCLDMKLESHRPLSAYKLPSREREVFLFNKTRLQANSPPPLPEQVDVLIEIADPQPPPPPPHNPHPLDDSSDPALKALPSYERQFRYHYHCGHAIYSRTKVKFEICERLLRQHKVQERAVDVARGNLDQYYKMMHQSYMDFIKCYSQQHRCNSNILLNFVRDIEKLRSCKLHPALQTANRKCLLDFVKEDNLPKLIENCSSSHRQFEIKVSNFSKMFGEVKRQVEDLFSTKASLPIRNLELKIKEHQQYINEQKSIMQSLSKDVNTVKKLVDDCLTCQLSSSLRPHDAVSALGPMYDVHDKSHLPKMQACDHSISKLLDFCKDNKNEMNIFVHRYMQKIAYISYIIKDARLQFPVFGEAMTRQNDQFADLKLVCGIGPAYRACLAEVVRRKASMKLYMGMAGQLAEKLATKREVEVRRREEFLKAHSSYIPRDILASMGLYDSPNQCDVNIAPFDANLLDIDISEIDCYAPVYLAGLHSKGKKHGTSKGSFSMSYDSELGDASVDTVDKSESELLEGCELVEIAGTSKMEVENAKLKAELASAIALICSFSPEVGYGSLDDSKLDSILKNAAEKTAEALRLKDEYGEHLHSMLRIKHEHCVSYEKRIQELEQRLSDQYSQGQKLSGYKDTSDTVHMVVRADDCKSEILGDSEAHMPYVSITEPMDDVFFISNSLDAKIGIFSGQPGKAPEGGDDNMTDYSGMSNPPLDSLLMELHREESQVKDKDEKDKMVGQLGMTLTNISTAESMTEPSNILPRDKAVELGLDSKTSSHLVLELQCALEDKSNQLSETEAKLKVAMEEVSMLGRELEISKKLLDESQMNCAHLENCLHEAREEAQTHLCAAERRASEYSALRVSAVKMRGFFERLRSCVSTSVGVAGFPDSLRALAQSLANSINDNENDGSAEFRQCIQGLADKVGALSRRTPELLDKCLKVEAANEHLRKQLEENKELVKTLYNKLQLEKQVNKEKISFGRFEVHEIAAFVVNPAGHYEAINRNCSSYYLSAESVALFTDHLPSRPGYIIGQIVHVERRSVVPPASFSRANQIDHLTSLSGTWNPYGLPVGCEYFVVTVAMLPDATIRSLSPS